MKSFITSLIAVSFLGAACSPDETTTAGDWAMGGQLAAVPASACSNSINGFVEALDGDPKYAEILYTLNAGFMTPPKGYNMSANPWASATYPDLVNNIANTFSAWCMFLPQISGDQDDGLKYIQHFAWFYYQNPAAQQFVQGTDPLSGAPDPLMSNFLEAFTVERGAYMDTAASTQYVAQWVDDPRIEIEDYQLQQPSDYATWNLFFVRNITIDSATRTIPSRPITMPDRNYVVVSPTDCIMNPLVQVLQEASTGGMSRSVINNPLQADTVIDVKGYPIGLNRLLGDAPEVLKASFVGGTGLACVLMPNTYHHYHSPVDGEIVYAEIVDIGSDGVLGTYGYYDFPNWAPMSGDVGRPGTDFSQFEVFQRGVIIIHVEYDGINGETLSGYVASIPVGLDTIGSVVFDPTTTVGAKVQKGYTRLGNFLYGGSLNILLFSKGISSGAVQTRLGNQITLLNAGTAPEETE